MHGGIEGAMRGIFRFGAAVIVMTGANLWHWQFGDAEAADRLALDKTQVQFSDIDGWAKDEHAAAFAAFRKSCRKMLDDAKSAEGVKAACELAVMLPEKLSSEDARQFFEANFKPYLVKRPDQGRAGDRLFRTRGQGRAQAVERVRRSRSIRCPPT